MDFPDHLSRVRSLLLAVADLSAEQRSRQLDQLCQGDSQLRQDVESLLEFDGKSSELFRTGCLLPDSRETVGSSAENPRTGNHPLKPSSDSSADYSGLIGQTISHYQIDKLIGQGGMGAIFLAQDLNLGRKVAIKLLSRLRENDPDAVVRFQNEARAVSALDHPNIGVIHEYGCTEAGQMYMVLGLQQGGSLRDRMTQPVSPELAIDLIMQVLSGLDAAHQVGIVHRDLKPENIMLCELVSEGTIARIIDFGLAKLADQGTITRTGAALGTTAYISPEQIQGNAAGPESDLFSVAVVLYELLTGCLPFDRETPLAMLMAIANDAADPLPVELTSDIPGIAAVLNRGLAKQAEDRYRSAQQMLADLEIIASQVAGSTVPEQGIPLNSAPGPSRRLTNYQTIGILLTVLIALAAVSFWAPLRSKSFGPRATHFFTIDQAVKPVLALSGASGRVFGTAVCGAGDVNGDGLADYIVADGPNQILSVGAAYLYLGGENLNSTADLVFQGETPEDHFGRLVRAVGDVNGDGFDDILISAKKFDSHRGRVYLFFGGADTDSIPDVVFSGDHRNHNFGASLAEAGDLNGDGLGDIAIGITRATGKTAGLSDGGLVAVFFGRANDQWPDTLSIAQADWQLHGDRIGQRLGSTLSCFGDLNHDGCDDLAVGTSNRKEVRIYFGGRQGLNLDAQVDMILEAGDSRGLVAAPAGDVNGDGKDDLLLTARKDGQGQVLVFFGGDQNNFPRRTANLILGSPSKSSSRFASSAVAVGDLNQDGYGDLLVADHSHDQVGAMAGGAYLFLGGDPMDLQPDAIFLGQSPQDRLGTCLASLGDINGDGKGEILIGAPGHDPDDYPFRWGNGAAYLYSPARSIQP